MRNGNPMPCPADRNNDSYIAGFLGAHLEGDDLLECMKKGSENAAVTIGYKGAW